MKTLKILMLMMLSSFAISQDTIVNVSVSGKALKVEFDDNSVKFMKQVTKVVPETAIFGTDYDGFRMEIEYPIIEVRTASTQTLTLSGNLSDGDTITIGTKNYVAEATLTNVDGHFHIGASASATIDNLIYSINTSTGVVGTDYATATTINTQVTAAAGAGDTMDITAKTRGTAGNSIASTETSSTASWGAATMTGGAVNGKLNLLTLATSWAAAQ